MDFQYVGKGCGIQDVAYCLSSCLSELEWADLADECLEVLCEPAKAPSTVGHRYPSARNGVANTVSGHLWRLSTIHTWLESTALQKQHIHCPIDTQCLKRHPIRITDCRTQCSIGGRYLHSKSVANRCPNRQ